MAVDRDVQSISGGVAGQVYVLGYDGNLWHESQGWEASGRTLVNSKVEGMMAYGNGAVIQVSQSRELRMVTASESTAGQSEYEKENEWLSRQGRNINESFNASRY